MSDAKKCAHSACNCMTTEKYCSAHCEENKDTVEIVCKCGHAGCTAEVGVNA
jgi:metallothionein